MDADETHLWTASLLSQGRVTAFFVLVIGLSRLYTCLFAPLFVCQCCLAPAAFIFCWLELNYLRLVVLSLAIPIFALPCFFFYHSLPFLLPFCICFSEELHHFCHTHAHLSTISRSLRHPFDRWLSTVLFFRLSCVPFYFCYFSYWGRIYYSRVFSLRLYFWT